MDVSKESLSAALSVLQKQTVDKIIADDRVTCHGLKILERWAQQENFTLQQLERNWETFLAVLLNQQKWEHPSSAERIELQLQNGLAYHEILELGAPDLSCRHAIYRMSLNAI